MFAENVKHEHELRERIDRELLEPLKPAAPEQQQQQQRERPHRQGLEDDDPLRVGRPRHPDPAFGIGSSDLNPLGGMPGSGGMLFDPFGRGGGGGMGIGPRFDPPAPGMGPRMPRGGGRGRGGMGGPFGGGSGFGDEFGPPGFNDGFF